MQAECETCLATARGGRIRLTQETSDLVWGLLKTEQGLHRKMRRWAIDNEALEDVTYHELELKKVLMVLEEVERTIEEKGWHRGQLQQPNPERSGPGASPRS